VQDDLYRHQLAYMPGSCDWVLETPEAETLFGSSCSTSIRFQGRPGTGKTILASFLVNHLKEKKLGCVLYFFCKAGDMDKREATHVHRTLLAQLLHQDPALYSHMEPSYAKSGRATADSFVNVSTCLSLALCKTSQQLLFVVVDALDECNDIDDLLQVLFDARRHGSAQINLVFTSRQIQTMHSFDEEVTLGSMSTQKPIRQYVSHRVLRMKTLHDDGLDQVVVRHVSREADGLWLYARLMLDEIESLLSAALVRRHLQSIPHGLTQLYTQILRSKESTFTATDLTFAQQIYLWLDVNDYIPVFLSSIDCMTYDTLSLVLQKVNFGEPVFNPIGLVSTLCSPLIEATDSSVDGSTASLHDYQITSTHYSADQYISESQRLASSMLPLVLRPRKLRQLHRGMTAVWYFTACDTSEKYLGGYRSNPFDADYGSYFEMAYGIWGALRFVRFPSDLDMQEISEASEMLQCLTDYISPNSINCLKWVESAIIINYASHWVHLQGNAEEGLAMMQAQAQITDSPALEAYRLARLTFFHDYVYVLRLTGPGEGLQEEQIPMPAGFSSRLLAAHMLQIGRRWQYLHRLVKFENVLDSALNS